MAEPCDTTSINSKYIPLSVPVCAGIPGVGLTVLVAIKIEAKSTMLFEILWNNYHNKY